MGSLLYCWAQVTLRKPQPHSQPGEQESVWSPSVCPLSVSIPSALAALALVASCVSGWEEGRGGRAGWGVDWVHHKSRASDQEG